MLCLAHLLNRPVFDAAGALEAQRAADQRHSTRGTTWPESAATVCRSASMARASSRVRKCTPGSRALSAATRSFITSMV